MEKEHESKLESVRIYDQLMDVHKGDSLAAAATLAKSFQEFPTTRTDHAVEALNSLLRDAQLARLHGKA